MNHDSDFIFLKYCRVNRRIQPEWHTNPTKRRVQTRAPREVEYSPPTGCKIFGNARTDITRGTGYGAAFLQRMHQYSPMLLPMRWAFAITENVIVVAGMLGKIVESTACTRVNP
jgi:hypothetical protein